MDLPHNPDYPYYLAESDLVDLVERIQNQDQEEWELFLSYAERREVTLGEILIHQFESGDAVYVLTDGVLEVRVASQPQGPEERVAVVEPIAIIGEQSFLDQGLRTATLAAKSQATVYRLTRAAFDELRHEHPDIACAFLFDLARALSQRARGLQARLRCLDS